MEELNRRLDAIEDLSSHAEFQNFFRNEIKSLPDLERLNRFSPSLLLSHFSFLLLSLSLLIREMTHAFTHTHTLARTAGCM